jgi:hypothetical protein
MLARWNVDFQTGLRPMPHAAESALARRVDFCAGREETERCSPLDRADCGRQGQPPEPTAAESRLQPRHLLFFKRTLTCLDWY